MIKKIEVVSLSRGTIGEDFVAHEIKLGKKRIADLGIELKFSDHALKGIDYLEKHPEDRAKDLIAAYKDESVDMILCAIGGEDTYRLLPYLFDNDELKSVVNDKIFLGYSDTTWNHFMLNKLGVKTYYGLSFLSDVCEIDKEMLPYSKYYFEKLLMEGDIDKIKPSDVWYMGREDYSEEALGTSLPSFKNNGFELLQGKEVFSGQIFGGCIDSIYDMFDNTRFEDTVLMTKKYNLFPSLDYWKGKILLLETSEEFMPVDKYEKALNFLKDTGIFNVINGILLGKPMNEVNKKEYEETIIKVVDNKELPIVANINIGHGLPRCVIPFNRDCTVDITKQEIVFEMKSSK